MQSGRKGGWGKQRHISAEASSWEKRMGDGGKTWFKMGKSPRVSSPNEPVAASAEGDKTALATHVLRDGCCCRTTISSATSLQPTPLTTGTDFLLTAVTSCQEWASLKLTKECEEGAKGEEEEEEEEEKKKKLRWALPSCWAIAITNTPVAAYQQRFHSRHLPCAHYPEDVPVHQSARSRRPAYNLKFIK